MANGKRRELFYVWLMLVIKCICEYHIFGGDMVFLALLVSLGLQLMRPELAMCLLLDTRQYAQQLT